MKKNDAIVTRVLDEATYVINTELTIREVAKHFGVSKTTVHTDLSKRLFYIDHYLYVRIVEIFEQHKALRHFLGGYATRQKYLKMKANIN